MSAQKLFVLCAAVDYEGEQFIGIFSSADACVDHVNVKSGNTFSGDYYSVYEREVDKPFLEWSGNRAILTLTVTRGGKVKVKKGSG